MAAPTGVALLQSNLAKPGDLVAVTRMSPALASSSSSSGVAVEHPGESTTSNALDNMVIYVMDCTLRQPHGPIPILVDGKPAAGVTAF